MKHALTALAFALVLAGSFAVPSFVAEAQAQATCRSKCTNEETACLKRTNNKSQCGGKAQTCMSKCK